MNYTKFLDSITYLSQNVDSALANDLMYRMMIMAGANPQNNLDNVVAAHLGLVSTSGAGVYVTNGEARRAALRALLLCQAVYLRPPVQQFDHTVLIDGGWPAGTINQWKSRSEIEIHQAIRIYVKETSADADAMVQAATMEPGENNVGLLTQLHRVARDRRPFPVEGTCYRAVQSWLLASGHVTLQWYLRSSVTAIVGLMTDANCVAAQLLAIFPQGVMVDVSNNFDGFNPNVGDIVYMYRANPNGVPKAGGQLGHWMVVGENGKGYGCNNFANGAALGTNPRYDRTSIRRQILAMRETQIQPGVPDSHFVRIFNPAFVEP